MFRSAFVFLTLASLAAVPSAQACDCGGCPPATCGTTSVEAPGSGLLFVRPTGQRGPLQAFDASTGHRRFSLPPGAVSANGKRYFALVRRTTALRAYDARTGKNLWNYRTNTKIGISATGITYQANGKQYVAVLQGGGGGNSNQQRPTNHGDIVNAFALP